MASTDPQRSARCPVRLAWKRPGVPTAWVRVLEEHPEGSQALPGYVWLDMPGKVRHVQERDLEFTDGSEPPMIMAPLRAVPEVAAPEA